MKWAWDIGRIAGIQLRIHVTFLLIVAWVAFEQWNRAGTIEAVLVGILFLFSLFACVVLHELGHALTARRYGIGTRDITLLPIGGVARLERMPERPLHELTVAVAGPAVNVVIALVIFAGLWVTSQGIPTPGDSGTISFWGGLMGINVLLVLFNLLPAFPMDGGRMVRALLTAWTKDYAKATRLAARLGQVMALAFALWGAMAGNPILIFIALFVWMGAAQESRYATMKSLLGGVTVERAMETDFRSLRSDASLSEAVDLLLAESQHDFPVVEEDRVVGLVRRADLLEAAGQLDRGTPIRDIMRADFSVMQADDPLEPALAKLQNSECRTIPVLRFGHLVGLVTLENLGEWLTARGALRPERR